MAESDGGWPESRSTPVVVGDQDELSFDRGAPDDETSRRPGSRDASLPGGRTWTPSAQMSTSSTSFRSRPMNARSRPAETSAAG